ncbi:MAG: haloacid dehalogenase type II [Alphaproteobacteria bacterium]|jgi:2-haloalkanoic acid dehalogenase type II
MKLKDFRVLTFDCYGTLIDWESGIHAALGPLIARAGIALGRDEVLAEFARHESAQEHETPGMVYSRLLAAVHRRLAAAWGVRLEDADHERFGNSVPDWPAFPDSAASLRYLKQHYRLVILSNVDREGFRGSNRRLGVEFDAIFTAQDIGSYKPDLRNFHYMLERLGGMGIGKGDILHTAQSLFHDHAPARQVGLATAWIDRRHAASGWGATMPPPEGTSWDFRFDSLAAMVAAHEAEAADGRRP